MASIFDFVNKTSWSETLKTPFWYREIVPQFKVLEDKTQNLGNKDKANLKQELYGFFEELYVTNKIFFGKEDGIWDTERKGINQIIIHHTSEASGMTPDRLSAIEIIRLYAPFYFSPYRDDEGIARDKPISSGHIRNGKQVFWPYHWIIRKNGEAERLLEDHEVGWQAGNWEINCRSIAIVFDGDFESNRPTDKQIATVATVIKKHYPTITPDNVLGHREVNPKTTCPSNLFLGEGGWKEKLVNSLL